MHSHEQHRAKVVALGALARKHNLTALATAADKHAADVVAASKAFDAGNLPAMKSATCTMLQSAADMIKTAPDDASPEVVDAGRDALKQFGVAIAASN